MDCEQRAIVRAIGIEREGWVRADPNAPYDYREFKELVSPEWGTIGSEVGVNHYEVMSTPSRTVGASVENLTALEGVIKKRHYLYRTSSRPRCVPGAGQWIKHDCYVCLHEAARAEVGEAWVLIHNLTNRAATHLNFSGEFDPFGPEGVFLYNILNNAAPYVAKRVHDRIGSGWGHLFFWDSFADARRFSKYERWFHTPGEFQAFFESIPRLIERRGETWAAQPGTTQQVRDALDHKVFWHFIRPKGVSKRDAYMELRILPSMSDEELQRVAPDVLGCVELALRWYFDNARGRSVERGEVSELFTLVHNAYPGLFPPSPLTKHEWYNYRWQ